MNEGRRSIEALVRRVTLRKRVLALEDAVSASLAVGGAIGAAVLVFMYLRPTGAARLPVLLVVLGLPVCAALIRWSLKGEGAAEAAFAIDQAFGLDDRAASAQAILNEQGPPRLFQNALIEDLAARLAGQRAASVVPRRLRSRHWLAGLSMIALAASLLIPSPGVLDGRADESADIESAGVRLEQAATEVQQLVPPESDTSVLAKQQAELGRALRQSNTTRVEALRRLSALDERIRARHANLKATRADEIVSIAEERLREGTLAAPRPGSISAPNPQTETPLPEDAKTGQTRAAEQSGETRRAAKVLPAPLETKSTPAATAASDPRKQPGGRPLTGTPQNQPQKPVSTDQPKSPVPGRAAESKAATGSKPGTKPGEVAPAEARGDASAAGQQSEMGRKPEDKRPAEQPSGVPDGLGALPGSLAERAVKAMPQLSEELLKKAAQLRANQLDHSDIEKLRLNAEALSRSLEQIAESQELRKELDEMARQVTAEQIERVARELANQDRLKRELEGAARLLAENKQARERVAGLASELAAEKVKQQAGQGGDRVLATKDVSRSPGQASQAGLASGAGSVEPPGRRLQGQGRQSNAGAALQQRPGGEFLFIQARAGSGAARAPYSSAYPRYRREAERSVQRTEVPPALRSMVRKYFDAINPNGKR